MKKALIIVAILVLVVGAPLLSKVRQGSSGKEIQVAEVEQRTIKSSVLASGKLVYREQVELRSEVIGRVNEVNVVEGQRVSENDVVLRINPEQFEAEVEQNLANRRLQEIAIERQQLTIANLERQMARKRDLFKRGLIDTDSFELAENELQIAQVDLRSRRQSLSQARAFLAQAQDRLDKTVIRSPIDGIVTSVNVKVGETVIAGTTNIPGSVMLTIADPSDVLAEINVDEADISKISTELEADIFAVAFPDNPFHGSVESIGTSARTTTAGSEGLSFLVKILLQDLGKLEIRTGMSCRGEIYTKSTEDALAVPIQSVLYDDKKKDAPRDEKEPDSYVFVAIDGKAKKRVVKIGLADDTHQEVLDGLEVSDQVIVGPYRELRHLKDGEAIKITEADEEKDKKEED